MLQQAIEQIGTPKNRNEEEKLRKYKTVVASIMSERHLAESGAQKCPRCKFTIEKNGVSQPAPPQSEQASCGNGTADRAMRVVAVQDVDAHDLAGQDSTALASFSARNLMT